MCKCEGKGSAVCSQDCVPPKVDFTKPIRVIDPSGRPGGPRNAIVLHTEYPYDKGRRLILVSVQCTDGTWGPALFNVHGQMVYNLGTAFAQGLCAENIPEKKTKTVYLMRNLLAGGVFSTTELGMFKNAQFYKVIGQHTFEWEE